MCPGILTEYGFKHEGNHYATFPWFGTKITLKHTKRSKRETCSTQVFVVTWNAMLSCSQLEGNVRSQCFVRAKWCLERNLMLLIAVVRPVMLMEVRLYQYFKRDLKEFWLWAGFESTTSAMPLRCFANWAIKATWELLYVG